MSVNSAWQAQMSSILLLIGQQHKQLSYIDFQQCEHVFLKTSWSNPNRQTQLNIQCSCCPSSWILDLKKHLTHKAKLKEFAKTKADWSNALYHLMSSGEGIQLMAIWPPNMHTHTWPLRRNNTPEVWVHYPKNIVETYNNGQPQMLNDGSIVDAIHRQEVKELICSKIRTK